MFKTYSVVVLSLSLLACQPQRQSVQTDGIRKIGDAEHPFLVMNSSALQKQVLQPGSAWVPTKPVAKTAMTEDPSPQPDPLYLVYPFGLLGHQSVFGGVITAVSDGQSSDLGGLKLSDLPPLDVRGALAKSQDGSLYFLLKGCVSECSEDSEAESLIGFPIIATNEKEGLFAMDLSSVGASLDLMKMIDPSGLGSGYKTKRSETVSVEYDAGSLIFDIDSHMASVDPKAPKDAPELVVRTRWYLRLSSVFNPAFKSRDATEGVGFFMTQRSAEPKLTRFSLDSKIHYFVKNVPDEFKPSFAAAFEEWNQKLKSLLGRDALTYQFIQDGDELAKQIIAGDIRYNVLEWDLKNVAGYGGLGPSVANQMTGQIFSAQVLIQGPVIVQLYQKWFLVSRQAQILRKSGREVEAEKVLAQGRAETSRLLTSLQQQKMRLKLNSKLDFVIQSQNPKLQDPLWDKENFDEIPEGYDYATYMDGYFKEMVAHELGHNLGLRHNFKGNYGYTSTSVEGDVSYSVMEYLPRAYRHMNRVSSYDVMAIAYGYKGIMPKRLNRFCTDENKFVLGDDSTSAECSSDDATADSFGYFKSRLSRALDLLVARGKPYVSEWGWRDEEMAGKVQVSLIGMSNYALSSEVGAQSWVNFYTQPGRPQSFDQVRGFVLNEIKAVLCDPTLADVVKGKDTEEARASTQEKIEWLRWFATQGLEEYSKKTISAADLKC